MRETPNLVLGLTCPGQVEYCAFSARNDGHMCTVQACEKHGIVLSPYCALAPLLMKTYGPLTELLSSIASSKSVTKTQVLLAWTLQTTNGFVST